MLEDERFWNNASIYEYKIMYCMVNSWILREHSDREWVSNDGG
jgi:hypothetical protein